MNDIQHAQRNISLMRIAKIFTKRVFLPLSAIYFIQDVGFTLGQIGLLGSFFYIVNFLADVPTGIFADRVGRAKSMRIGALLNVFSTLLYVFAPNKPAIVFATALEAIGYGFFTGAGEALIHDSLVVLKKIGSYTKVVSRIQSTALIFNAIILALVPLTYSIDHRLPFLLGTVSYALLLLTSLFLKDVTRESTVKVPFRNLGVVFKAKGALSFAICFGIIGALYTAQSDFVNIAFKDLGMDPSRLGLIFSLGSVAGAIFGVFFHYVKKLSLARVLVLDGFFATAIYLAIFIGSLPLLTVTSIFCLCVWRYRRILYQERMLVKFPGQPKATLLSIMSNLEGIQQMWMPVATGLVVSHLGLQSGFGVITIFATIVAVLFVFTARKFFSTE